MKYFTTNLWEEMQCSSARSVAERKWDKNVKVYASYFSNIKEHLPKNFLKIFDKEYGFHDFVIEKISVTSLVRKTMPNTMCVMIQITNGKNQYEIMLKDVETSNVNIIDKSYCIRGKLSWGYTEFELLEDLKMELRILCDVYNELSFVFNKISIKKY